VGEHDPQPTGIVSGHDFSHAGIPHPKKIANAAKPRVISTLAKAINNPEGARGFNPWKKPGFREPRAFASTNTLSPLTPALGTVLAGWRVKGGTTGLGIKQTAA